MNADSPSEFRSQRSRLYLRFGHCGSRVLRSACSLGRGRFSLLH